MSALRNLLDSFVLILIGYSIFELSDRIISTIIMKFPASYSLFDFCWLAFSSAYYLIVKAKYDYYSLLAFVSIMIIVFVEILVSEDLKEALSKEFTTVLFLYLLSGEIYRLLLLLTQPLSNISITFLVDLKASMISFITLYLVMVAVAVFYFKVSQKLTKYGEEEEIFGYNK